jgi:hypothetical protein
MVNNNKKRRRVTFANEYLNQQLEQLERIPRRINNNYINGLELEENIKRSSMPLRKKVRNKGIGTSFNKGYGIVFNHARNRSMSMPLRVTRRLLEQLGLFRYNHRYLERISAVLRIFYEKYTRVHFVAVNYDFLVPIKVIVQNGAERLSKRVNQIWTYVIDPSLLGNNLKSVMSRIQVHLVVPLVGIRVMYHVTAYRLDFSGLLLEAQEFQHKHVY